MTFCRYQSRLFHQDVCFAVVVLYKYKGVGIDLIAWPTLHRLLQRPGEMMQPFTEALDQAARNANPKYLSEEEEVLLGFEGPFGFHRLTPRELLSPFLSTMVSVEGIVTKCECLYCLIRYATV